MPRDNGWMAQRTARPGPCPCGSGQSYVECCGRHHRGEASPPTAEALMRARFSAFALGDADFLRRTWHRTTRPDPLQLDSGQRWTRLEILGHTGGAVFDAGGTVDFRAHYRVNGLTGAQSENSAFVRDGGEWRYLGCATRASVAR